jgi:hypothetical protein
MTEQLPKDQLGPAPEGYISTWILDDGKSRFWVVAEGVDEETQALNCLIQVLEQNRFWVNTGVFQETRECRELTKEQRARLSEYLVRRYRGTP